MHVKDTRAHTIVWKKEFKKTAKRKDLLSKTEGTDGEILIPRCEFG